MTTPVPRFRRQVPVGRGGCHKRLERSQVRTAIIDAFKEPFKLEHGDIVIEESLAIIWAIVALAEALGMSTTAEGVESLDQVAQVARRRLHTVFSQPRPSSEIADLFAQRLQGGENSPQKPSRCTA